MIRAVMVASMAAFFGGALIHAQDVNAVPPGSLFASSTASTSRDNLDVMTFLSQGYDTEAPPELRSRIPQESPQSGGFSTIVQTTANYARKRNQFTLDSRIAASLRYLPRADQVSLVGSSAAVGGALPLPSHTTLEFNQDGTYSPSYLFKLFPTLGPTEVGDTPPAAPDYRTDQTRSYALNSTVKVSAGSPRHTHIEVQAKRDATNFQDTITVSRPNLDIWGGSGRWSQGVGRTGFVSAEYEYRRGEFGYGGHVTEQRLRIGAEFAPALSRTRRATFGFNIAPSAMKIPESAILVAQKGTLYKIEGGGSLQYQFFRSWSMGGTYRRGIEYIAALREPVFNDSFRLALSGLVSPRIDVSISAGASTGTSALNATSDSFDTYTGTVRGRYAVGRSLALYGEYLYYHYDFHNLSQLVLDAPGRFQQHGFRVGAMLWNRPLGR